MRFARLFDRRDKSGEWTLDLGRPRVTDPDERARIGAFLAGGVTIVRINDRDDDLLDPSRRHAVPLHIQTDGTWIWNSGVRYYLEQHGIAPEPDFLAHIEAHEYVAVEPEEPVWRRALAELRARQG
jgi:hypothetical protein